MEIVVDVEEVDVMVLDVVDAVVEVEEVVDWVEEVVDSVDDVEELGAGLFANSFLRTMGTSLIWAGGAAVNPGKSFISQWSRCSFRNFSIRFELTS